jgi:hypothetical protein
LSGCCAAAGTAASVQAKARIIARSICFMGCSPFSGRDLS